MCSEKDNRSKNRGDIRGSFSNWIFFVIIPLMIVGVLLAKTILFYCKIGDITDVVDLEVFLNNTNLLDMGIGVVSIAISVWLGINIANLVDRREIERIKQEHEKIKQSNKAVQEELITLEKDINETKDIPREYYVTKMLSLFDETVRKYDISMFFYMDVKNCPDEYDMKTLKAMIDIEQEFLLCVNAYEKCEWYDTYKYGESILKKLEKMELKTDYFKLRKADVLFYINVAKTHTTIETKNGEKIEFSEREMIKSIEIYEELVDSFAIGKNKDKLLGYFHNTIGYTYDLMERRISIKKGDSEDEKEGKRFNKKKYNKES